MNERDEEQDCSPPAMPQLPDGKGLDYDQVAALLAEKSKVVVERDDPLMMLIPLLNCFLAEEEALLLRHNEALTRVLGERADSYARTVRQVSEELGETLSTKALSTLQNSLKEHQELLARHNSATRWTAMIIALSALINVAVFMLMWILKLQG